VIYQVKSIKPNHDLVLVKRLDTTKTPAGLTLPEARQTESNLVKVVAVGPGLPGKPETQPKCTEGEYWLMARYIGTQIFMDNEEYVLVKWSDCLAKIELLDESLIG